MDHDLAAPGLKCKRGRPAGPVPSAYRSRSQTRYWRKKDSILSKGMMSIRSYRSVWTAAGHFLGVKAGGLLLDGAEGPADGQGGQRARSPFGPVEVGGQGDAVPVVERHLPVLHTAV